MTTASHARHPAEKSHRGHSKSVADLLATRRFLFVTGKGGVGKTTVSGALALAMAAHGKRVLVAMCNAKERLSAILGTRPIGHDVIEVAPNVHAVNILPEQALEEYGGMVIGSERLAGLVFDNKYVKAFFRAVPGLYEWSMLGKAWWHTTEKRADGSWKYDVVLLDAPATGHGLDMLRVPKVTSTWCRRACCAATPTPRGPCSATTNRAAWSW